MLAHTEASEFLSLASARREHELLLLCAHTKVCDEAAQRIKALVVEAIDWEYLFLLAQRHAVLPLLHKQLNAHASDALPHAFRQKLATRFRENATRNILLTAELVKIVKLFEGEGVAVIAYKGPALAMCAYGDIALRRFIDLDIIVRKRDVRRAGALLQTLGYATSCQLSQSHEEILLRSQHNLAYERDGGKLIVEVHWDVAARQYASVSVDEASWERAVTVPLRGGEVKSLSPEELLLALCVHGTKHLWERLAWICDVAELVNSQAQLDWDFVFKLAEASHTERMLRLGLRLAFELLEAELPEGARRQIHSDETVARLASKVVGRLFDGAEYEPAGLVQSINFNLRARQRLREKLQYFGFIFKPTDGDLASVSLPSGLTFVYYLLRPLRLLRKGAADH
jgi:hypothetical protein